MVGSFPATPFGAYKFAAILVPSLQMVSLRTLTSSGSVNGAACAGWSACCADAEPMNAANATVMGAMKSRIGEDLAGIAIARRRRGRASRRASGCIPARSSLRSRRANCGCSVASASFSPSLSARRAETSKACTPSGAAAAICFANSTARSSCLPGAVTSCTSPDAVRLVGAKILARHHVAHRVSPAGFADEADGRAAARKRCGSHLALVEDRVLCRHPHVGRQEDFVSNPRDAPLHRDDEWFGALGSRSRDRIDEFWRRLKRSGAQAPPRREGRGLAKNPAPCRAARRPEGRCRARICNRPGPAR